MEKHEVVPDIIDVVPEHVAEIAWSDDVMTNMGKELTPTQVGEVLFHQFIFFIYI